jgi:hypothetical protein
MRYITARISAMGPPLALGNSSARLSPTDRRQLRHLMAHHVAGGIGRRRLRAVATRWRGERDDGLYALGRDEAATTPRMARLAAAATATPRPWPTRALPPGEPVRRGRFRRDRGILLAERQPALQLRDLLRLLRQLTSKLGVFTILGPPGPGAAARSFERQPRVAPSRVTRYASRTRSTRGAELLRV